MFAGPLWLSLYPSIFCIHIYRTNNINSRNSQLCSSRYLHSLVYLIKVEIKINKSCTCLLNSIFSHLSLPHQCFSPQCPSLKICFLRCLSHFETVTAFCINSEWLSFVRNAATLHLLCKSCCCFSMLTKVWDNRKILSPLCRSSNCYPS